MGQRNLPTRILQNIGIRSLQHSRRPSAKTSRMFAQSLAASTCLDANQPDSFVVQEIVENPDRIRPAAYTCNDRSRQLSLSLQYLRPRLASDHTMKITYHGGIRMRSQHT